MEPKAPLRKLNPVLATTLQQELVKVVQHGTARRLKGAYNIADTFPAGGKTGTGDNRYTVKDADGKEQQVLANRTATFAFFLGQRWFGVVTAYAPDNADFRHKFTSSLPVSILKSLSENLAPLLESPKPHQPLPLANSHKELPVQAH